MLFEKVSNKFSIDVKMVPLLMERMLWEMLNFARSMRSLSWVSASGAVSQNIIEWVCEKSKFSKPAKVAVFDSTKYPEEKLLKSAKSLMRIFFQNSYVRAQPQQASNAASW